MAAIAAFFSSLHKTLVAGVVLLIVLIVLVGLVTGQFIKLGNPWWLFFWRWLHIMAGITVQKIEPAEHRAAITKFIAPNVLFWFRYSALATVVFGLILAFHKGYLIQALTFHKPVYTIGIGMWLALIMAFNVWFIIWPNQKKVLGLVSATSEEKVAAAKLAGMTSRINTMLSIPMLYCMVAQQNGGL